MKAPLYMMSAGDLGVSSSGVESSLSNVLEMATKWNAILLLDEADVFLEQRSAHDLERNKLVSIFLRILEYYEGILFLTTNRVDNIDAAFQSRIHISMQYNELSTSSRRHVWNNFLTASSKSKKHGLSDEDLDKLADYMMNGREIKNVLKTAQLLAHKKGSELGYEHVKSVLAIEKRYIIDGKA
jgi:SpoVK/Ycf46/Vps4 family AAA+-type ATPase